MMTHPDFDKVWYGKRGMRAGIRACVEAKCVVSAVTLIYSAVDAMAALDRTLGSTKATRKEFKNWVDRYLIKHLNVLVTAEDVYGARCYQPWHPVPIVVAA